MRGYTTRKLASKPRKVKAWRTLRVGPRGVDRLLLAILPNGKSRAVELFKPRKKR